MDVRTLYTPALYTRLFYALPPLYPGRSPSRCKGSRGQGTYPGVALLQPPRSGLAQKPQERNRLCSAWGQPRNGRRHRGVSPCDEWVPRRDEWGTLDWLIGFKKKYERRLPSTQ